MAHRRKRFSAAQSTAFLDTVAEMTHLGVIEVFHVPPPEAIPSILKLANEHQLTAYDAACLDLAIRRSLPLATADQALRKAAGQCGVSFWQPS